MNLIEKISDQELKMFDRYRNDYIEDVVGRPASVEDILSYWNSAKNEGQLFQLLDNHLMIQKEIVSEKAFEEMENAIDRLLYSGKEFVRVWRNFIYEKFIELKLDRSSSEYIMYYNMDRLMLRDALIANTYEGETFFVDFPNGDKYKVQKGCKVSKALGKIANAFDIPGFEEFRIAHSQILNEKQLKGTMTLSIHPLDYITMSDNDCDWTSCMSWKEDGEYRRGTVEMMNSPCVIIAYLNAKNDMTMGGGTWSNKKWRELFIVNKDCVAGIKGYPYWNRNLEKIALDWIKELAETNLGFEYTKEAYEVNAPNSTTTVQVDELQKEIEVCFYTDAMYNDCYDHHYCYFGKHFENMSPCRISLNYSGASECMWCGSVDCDFSYESNLACGGCDDELYCSKCGERLYEDSTYWINGEAYCSYCYDELPRCSSCEEVLSDSEWIRRVYLSSNGKIFKWIYTELCEDCYENNDYIPQDLFKEYKVDGWRYITYLRIEDLDQTNQSLVDYVLRLYDLGDLDIKLPDHPYWDIEE